MVEKFVENMPPGTELEKVTSSILAGPSTDQTHHKPLNGAATAATCGEIIPALSGQERLDSIQGMRALAAHPKFGLSSRIWAEMYVRDTGFLLDCLREGKIL